MREREKMSARKDNPFTFFLVLFVLWRAVWLELAVRVEMAVVQLEDSGSAAELELSVVDFEQA
jgi:hypothetical protein